MAACLGAPPAALLGLRRRQRLLRPAPLLLAAALHGPPPPGLQRLLERWRARRPPRGPPPGDAALQALFSSPPFCHRRPPRFARTMAGWLPAEAEGLSPATVALIAQYAARHRLRQPPLLDAIAAFLLRRARQLDAKVIQRLVFPFSRTNYRPSNHPELFPQLESVLLQKGAASPLATVNTLLSLFQLCHFPVAVLHQVFSPAFLDNVTSSPCGLIVRRYLSLLDVAVALEVQGYDGPRLDPRFRICMFDGALTADKANHKYSYKGLVAEALRQLVGEGGYRQDEVLPPGYCADFLLRISPSGSVLPQSSQAEAPDVQTLPLDTLSGSLSRQQRLGSPLAGSCLLPDRSPHSLPPQRCGWCLGKEPCVPTRSSPTTMGHSPAGSLCSTAESAARSSLPTLGTQSQRHLLMEGQPLPPAPAATPGAVPDGTQKAKEIHRVVLSVNDKWHYCQNSAVLVGSRAMRDRHLRLLGYNLVQLSYMDLERVCGVEGAKQYLCRKLSCLQLQA